MEEHQWMKLPRLKNLSIWYPQSDMKLSLKSLENSFLNFTTFYSQAQTFTDVIRVSPGFLLEFRKCILMS